MIKYHFHTVNVSQPARRRDPRASPQGTQNKGMPGVRGCVNPDKKFCRGVLSFAYTHSTLMKGCKAEQSQSESPEDGEAGIL